MALPTKAEVKDWIEQIEASVYLLTYETDELEYVVNLLEKQRQLLKDLLKGLKQ